MTNVYSELEADHGQIRNQLNAEQNAELDGMRANGKSWDRLGYAALALTFAYISYLLIAG